MHLLLLPAKYLKVFARKCSSYVKFAHHSTVMAQDCKHPARVGASKKLYIYPVDCDAGTCLSVLGTEPGAPRCELHPQNPLFIFNKVGLYILTWNPLREKLMHIKREKLHTVCFYFYKSNRKH